MVSAKPLRPVVTEFLTIEWTHESGGLNAAPLAAEIHPFRHAAVGCVKATEKPVTLLVCASLFQSKEVSIHPTSDVNMGGIYIDQQTLLQTRHSSPFPKLTC